MPAVNEPWAFGHCLISCPHCGSDYIDGHYVDCKRSVLLQTGDHNRTTGFDGTYEAATHAIGTKEGSEGRA